MEPTTKTESTTTSWSDNGWKFQGHASSCPSWPRTCRCLPCHPQRILPQSAPVTEPMHGLIACIIRQHDPSSCYIHITNDEDNDESGSSCTTITAALWQKNHTVMAVSSCWWDSPTWHHCKHWHRLLCRWLRVVVTSFTAMVTSAAAHYHHQPTDSVTSSTIIPPRTTTSTAAPKCQTTHMTHGFAQIRGQKIYVYWNAS